MLQIRIDSVTLWVSYSYTKSTGDNTTPSSEDVTIFKVIPQDGEDITPILDSHVKTEDIYDDIKCQIIIYEQSRQDRED